MSDRDGGKVGERRSGRPVLSHPHGDREAALGKLEHVNWWRTWQAAVRTKALSCQRVKGVANDNEWVTGIVTVALENLLYDIVLVG